MLTVVVVIHLMLVIALIGVVLLQKSEGGGLVSSTSGFLSSRGTANVLSRTTALAGRGFLRHQPRSVMACKLRAPAGLDHQYVGGTADPTVGASRRSAGNGAVEPGWWRAAQPAAKGHTEFAGRVEPGVCAGAERAASAAVEVAENAYRHLRSRRVKISRTNHSPRGSDTA